ncbi:MAG: glycogen-binding domain-containing protein [Atribacterota bacterium]
MVERKEKLDYYLERLPKFTVSRSFAPSVMARIRERQRPSYRRYKRLVVALGAAVLFVLMLTTNLPLTPRLEFFGYRTVKLVFCSTVRNPKTVAVAGDFSDWESIPMERVDENCYALTLRLRPGKYEYGFLVDGQWVPDPFSPRTVSDGFGGMNSILVVDGDTE